MVRFQNATRNLAAFAALIVIACTFLLSVFAGTYTWPPSASPLQTNPGQVATSLHAPPNSTLSDEASARATRALPGLNKATLASGITRPFGPSQTLPASLAVKTSIVEPSPFVSDAVKGQISQAYGKLPLTFEANRGQTADSVNFLHRARNYTLFLTSNEAVIAFGHDQEESMGERKTEQTNGTPGQVQARTSCAKPKATVLKMKLLGADSQSQGAGLEELPGKVNYFIGKDRSKWHSNIPTYSKVKYDNCYPGIDLIYYGNQQQLEYDFVVAPGADPDAIRLTFEGAEQMTVDESGDLVLELPAGDVRLRKPFIYQKSANGAHKEIAGGYVLDGRAQVSFKVAAYDRARPLVIDPVLIYSTYLGGGGSDIGQSIAVDTSGNAYVTGWTLFSADFPTTSGASDTTPNGLQDVFVSKMNADGSTLVYSTYLGGSSTDNGLGIAVDAIGNAYLTGRTLSTNFPTTSGAFDTTMAGGGFVTKLNADGSALMYSASLDGGQGAGIAVDTSGNAHVMGYTRNSNFPTTPGAYDTTANTDNNFVTKVNADGSALLYSTHLGASSPIFSIIFNIKLGGIAVDAAGDIYVTSLTYSNNFPTTPGAFDTTFNGTGMWDAFIAKLHPAGGGSSDLVYCTYLGGGRYDRGIGIAVDESGNAYVVGTTESSDFPTTNSAFDTSYNGSSDLFVAKVNADGSGLVYSTYLGGGGSDGSTYNGSLSFETGGGIAVDADGNACVTALTTSGDFPTTTGAFDRTFNGNSDAFVARLNADASGLLYSTYLGRSGFDAGAGIALDGEGYAYVTGHTVSASFPTTSGAFDTTHNGGYDAFVVKLSLVGPINQPPSATDDFYGMNQGTSHMVPAPGVLANDSDPDDDALTAELVSGPSNASFFQLNADGSFTYTPPVYFVGEDSFTYRANDGTEYSEVATVHITVSQPGSAGFITGGGKIFQDGRECTFGFVAKVLSGGVQGQLEFQDHEANMDVKSQSVQWVYAPSQVDGYFSGTCQVNGVSGYTFFVQVHDQGQPGSNDDFTIWVLDSFNNPVYTSGGVLAGGNIMIHGN